MWTCFVEALSYNKIDILLFNSQVNYIHSSIALILSVPSLIFVEMNQINNKAFGISVEVFQSIDFKNK